MVKLRYTFAECEHHSDLAIYAEDIKQCDGEILNEDLNFDEEEGTITFEVKDHITFYGLFAETLASEFKINSEIL